MRLHTLGAIAFAVGCGLFPDVGRLSGSGSAGYSRTITIVNTSSSALPVGYTIGVEFPESDLQDAITAGKIRSDFENLRVRDGAAERDRMIDDPPLARIVWFSISSTIAPGATDTTYTLSYGGDGGDGGDGGASSAPANGTNVFTFFDDFDAPTLSSAWASGNAMTPSNGILTLGSNLNDVVGTNAPLDPQTTLDMRVRVVDPTSTDGSGDPTAYLYWFGFQRSGDLQAQAPWALWLSDGASLIGEFQMSDGCEKTCNGTDITQTSAFRIYEIERQPTLTNFSVDGAQMFSTPAQNDQAMAILLRSYLNASDIQLDWVRARHCIYPEPTVTLGAEHSP